MPSYGIIRGFWWYYSAAYYLPPFQSSGVARIAEKDVMLAQSLAQMRILFDHPITPPQNIFNGFAQIPQPTQTRIRTSTPPPGSPSGYSNVSSCLSLYPFSFNDRPSYLNINHPYVGNFLLRVFLPILDLSQIAQWFRVTVAIDYWHSSCIQKIQPGT